MRVLILAAVLLLPALTATATFDFEMVMDHQVAVGNLYTGISLHGVITNTGDERDTIALHKDEFLPATWTSSFCVGISCWPPDVHDIEVTLDPAASEEILLDFQLSPLPGWGYDLVTFTSQGNGASVQLRLSGIHEDCDVLVVDDSEEGTDVTSRVLTQLAPQVGGVWLRNDELPTLADLNLFSCVYWLTGSQGPSLDADDQALVEDFLGGGGGMMLSGQDLAQNLCDPADPHWTSGGQAFCEGVLGVTWAGDSSQPNVDGIPGDFIGDGLYLELDAGQTDPDILAITGGVASYSFQYAPLKDIDQPAGVLSTDNGRMVFLGFGVEGIVDDADLATLLERVCIALQTPTAAGEETAAAGLALLGNFPNPFNPKTSIRFSAPEAGTGMLKVYDLKGRLLQERALQVSRGLNSVDFEGRDLSSGLYFYQVRLGGESRSGRMLLAK